MVFNHNYLNGLKSFSRCCCFTLCQVLLSHHVIYHFHRLVNIKIFTETAQPLFVSFCFVLICRKITILVFWQERHLHGFIEFYQTFDFFHRIPRYLLFFFKLTNFKRIFLVILFFQYISFQFYQPEHRIISYPRLSQVLHRLKIESGPSSSAKAHDPVF